MGSGSQASGAVAQGAGPPGSRAQAQRLWHRAWPLRGVRALPGSGVEAGFPALAGEFFTTGPPVLPFKDQTDGEGLETSASKGSL